MNLPNRLTLLRVVMVPIFLVFMLLDELPLGYLWALIVFALASVTDFFDGFIARKYNMTTTFGKFLDPLADKILVCAALICFVQFGWAPAWVIALIIAREFAVSGVRLIAATSEEKTVIAANIWGKLKTASTMIAIVLILLMQSLHQLGLLPNDLLAIVPTASSILVYICGALTVWSGIVYIYDYRKLLTAEK